MVDPEQESELTQLRQNGQEALGVIFSRYQERLEKMIRFRLDRRLWGRVDSADVLQDAYVTVSQRLDDFLRDPSVPVFIWLRAMTEQVLVNVHRQHLGAKIRDAHREVPLHGALTTSDFLASRLAADLTSPSQVAMREEMLQELRGALETMDPIDREVLALRHFEELSNNEVAQVLGLQKAAASNRYVRALKRLRDILGRMSQFCEERDGQK
jgi:RNA polymerase sigma-70 factor (ECF subfamily)